jgi:hypothetical protein
VLKEKTKGKKLDSGISLSLSFSPLFFLSYLVIGAETEGEGG